LQEFLSDRIRIKIYLGGMDKEKEELAK